MEADPTPILPTPLQAPIQDPATTQLAKKPQKTAPAQHRILEVSCTIAVGSVDIDMHLLQTVELFMERECISGLCALERGGVMARLHFQAVFKIMSTIPGEVSKLLKKYLGWDKSPPSSSHVLTKNLTGNGLHTYLGMLGYCTKDRGGNHFVMVRKNVSEYELKDGLEEYVKFGNPYKDMPIVLTSTNVMLKGGVYVEHKMNKQIGSTIPGVLLHMLRSGTYIPDANWVVPRACGGMDYSQASSMWKCMVFPATIEMEDVCKIFFVHSSPPNLPFLAQEAQMNFF
jgi:hypothetical protein